MKGHKSESKFLILFILLIMHWIDSIVDCFRNARDAIWLPNLSIVLVGLVIWFRFFSPWVKSRVMGLDQQDQKEVYLNTALQYGITWVLALGELAPRLAANIITERYPEDGPEYFIIGILVVGLWFNSLNGLTNYNVLSIQVKPPLLYWTRFFPITAFSIIIAWLNREALGFGKAFSVVCCIFIIEYVLVWTIAFLRNSKKPGVE